MQAMNIKRHTLRVAEGNSCRENGQLLQIDLRLHSRAMISQTMLSQQLGFSNTFGVHVQISLYIYHIYDISKNKNNTNKTL